MSRTIDERVVEMRFDNKEFEQNAKTTMSTLTKLKEFLNMTDQSKSFDALDKSVKNVSLDGIAAGVEALQKRFSTFGIISMRVIENVTDSLMGIVTKGFNFVQNAIVSGGIKRAMNIENAHFQLQALLKDEEKVQAIMDDAMASVSDTAYAYDEAAKAASQFAASGLESGEKMQTALRGIVGVAAMTNSEYEGISRIFTTVAGNGRLMGDQLLQLSSRGLNAASTIADYFREVRNQTGMTESAIREMVSKGQIDFETFAAAMDWAFGESAFRANETFTGVLSNIRAAFAKIGAGFFSPLIEQNSDLILMLNSLKDRINDVKKAVVFDEKESAISGLTKVTGAQIEVIEEMFDSIDKRGAVTTDNLLNLSKYGVNATDDLTNYINGVTNGTIRAGYATKTALNELTNGLEVEQSQVRKFVEEGKISVSTFTSAMETTYGDQRKLSKQFTDTVLNLGKRMATFLSNLDLTKPLQIFYHGFESIKNICIGLYSVLKPVGQAFASVFLNFKADDVVNLASKIQILTSKMKLSEQGSRNLRDLFEGLFNIVKLLGSAFLSLVRLIIPVGGPISDLSGGLLELSGAAGRALTKFTEWIKNSTKLNKVYSVIYSGMRKATMGISNFTFRVRDFIRTFDQLPVVKKLISAVTESFKQIGEVAAPYISILIKRIKEFRDELGRLIPEKVEELGEALSKKLEKLGDSINRIDFSRPSEMFKKFLDVLKETLSSLSGNSGLESFIGSMRKFFNNMKELFSFDSLLNNIEHFREVVGSFVNWIKDILGPMFSGFSIGGGLAAAGGFGMIYSLIKIAKSFESATKSFTSIPKVLSGVNDALKAYQDNLKADTLTKIAKAIILLAGALVILSFANLDQVDHAAVTLSIAAAAIAFACSKLSDVLNRKGKSATDALYVFSKNLGKSIKTLAKSIQIKAIGSAIKDFGITLALVAGSIIALAIMYRRDADSMKQAVFLVEMIAAVMVGIMAAMTFVSQWKAGQAGFLKSALSITALSLSLNLAVSALNKLFKMELPKDWGWKLGILGGIFAGLGTLSIILGKATKESSGNKLSSGPILALTASLMVTVIALEKLFKMKLPNDYWKKLLILGNIFAALIGVIYVVGLASKQSGGVLKAAGTILSMCVFIGVVVGALMILSVAPFTKLLKGAVSLGIVLLALGGSLYGAGKVSSPESFKSVLAMAVLVGAITASLGILSMVPITKLAKSASALCVMLMFLAVDFLAIGKIANEKSWATVAALAATLVVISGSLYLLSSQSLSGLSTAAATISATLLAFAGVMKLISSGGGVRPDQLGLFLVGILALIPIGITLSELSKFPWKNVLSSGVALSAVIISFGAAFSLISATKPNLVGIGAFLAGAASIGLIAVSLNYLANQPWENILASGTAISEVLLSMSISMGICSLVGAAAPAAIAGIALLDLFIANFILVLAALGTIFNDPTTKAVLSGGTNVLGEIGNAIGSFAGNIVGGFLGSASDSLPQIGKNLAEFMNAGKPFFNGIKEIDESSLKGVLYLSEAILDLTAGSIIDGLTSWLTGGTSLSKFGEELALFGPSFSKFSDSIANVDGEKVQAAANSAQILADMASTLPNSGGLSALIFGDNRLSDFSEELALFGPSLAEFSNTVKDVDASAVESATNSARIMAEMATNLPNSGGLSALIFGDNRLSDFGKELAEFGPYISEYANSVSGIDASAVEASANAAKALSELASNLPNTGGLVSLFTGDNGIDKFGSQLSSFGQSFQTYYNYISVIDSGKLSAITTGLESILDLIEKASEVNTSETSAFVSGFNAMGDLAVDKLANAISNGSTKVIAAITTIVTNLLSAIQLKVPQFQVKGLLVATTFLTGIRNRIPEANSVGQTIANNVLSGIQNRIPEFLTKGGICSSQFLTGIKNKYPDALSAGKSLAENVLSGIGNLYDKFYTSGSNAGSGFVDGLRSKMNDATSAGRAIGEAAYNAARAALDEHSPSRKMAEVADFAGLGFINTLMLYVAKAEKVGEDLGNSTIEGTRNTISRIATEIDENMNVSPVIRPMLDLSNLEKSTSRIDEMFNRSISTTLRNVDFADSGMQRRSKKSTSNLDSNNQNQDNKSGNSYSFVQNNYSPKALSRIDIYRNTKNQFSQLKEATGLND